jgi:predicted nucleic acid-binding protein
MRIGVSPLNDYVVDASIVIQHLITDRYTPNVDALFEQLNQDVRLHAPEFCVVECTNILWKNVRRSTLPQDRALDLATDVANLQITFANINELLQSALEIGLRQGLAVYDSVYIALARALNCPLITDDEKQAKAASSEGVRVKPITDFVP